MLWREYTMTLSDADHRRLVIALGAGLAEARQASEIATNNGDVLVARTHVATAIHQLTEALALLRPSGSMEEP